MTLLQLASFFLHFIGAIAMVSFLICLALIDLGYGSTKIWILIAANIGTMYMCANGISTAKRMQKR